MAKKNPKSMRNAFIRVSAENHVKSDSKYHEYHGGDIVKYSFEQICQLLNDWAQTKGLTYYTIEHNPDIDEDNQHYHIVIRFSSPTQWEQIKKQFPFGSIDNCKKGVTKCVQYLVHLNDITKAQYSWDNIVHNDPEGLERFKAKNDDVLIKEIIEKIGTGEINDYNLTDYVSIDLYSKKKRRINDALEYYKKKVLMNPKRNILTFVIQGDSGSGKSTFAKAYCDHMGWSFAESSSQNDPWQDYQGQDVMILNDLRASTFSIADLLKMIDPFVMSSAKSRYVNKLFLGKAIFITTNVPIQKWYSGESVDDETRIALFRRINKILEFKRTDEPNIAEYYPIDFDIDTKSFLEYRDSKYQFDTTTYITKEEESKRISLEFEADIEGVMNNQIVEVTKPIKIPMNDYKLGPYSRQYYEDNEQKSSSEVYDEWLNKDADENNEEKTKTKDDENYVPYELLDENIF